MTDPNRQAHPDENIISISIRLPEQERDRWRKHAKAKGSSIGDLVRTIVAAELDYREHERRHRPTA